MNRYAKGLLLASAMVGAVTLTQGCATSIKPSTSQNPAPTEAFKDYGRIEVKSVVFKSGVKGNNAALAKINQNIQHDLAASLEEWNKRPANGRTLVIEPVVEQMSFKGGASRVFLGPLVGSSGVLMRMNIHDADGRVVATPEFFQRANAMAAGWTLGVHDNMMLTRVANLSTNYVKANYNRTMGGPTGGDDAIVDPK